MIYLIRIKHKDIKYYLNKNFIDKKTAPEIFLTLFSLSLVNLFITNDNLQLAHKSNVNYDHRKHHQDV